jgi:hypothetical protein
MKKKRENKLHYNRNEVRMYGWILASLESMILNKFGTELWSKIQEAAHIPVKTGEFIKNVHYSEEIMFNLLQNSTKNIECPSESSHGVPRREFCELHSRAWVRQYHSCTRGNV